MRGVRRIDELLRGEGAFEPSRSTVAARDLIAVVVVLGFAYGAAMGSYAGRPLQAAFSGAKVPMLLGVSTLICLANFFVVNAMLGLRDDFSAALRAVLTAQAGVAVTLIAFAPVTLFFYASLPDTPDAYVTAVAANGVVFLFASLGGQLVLNRGYRALVARDPRHRLGKLAWLALYVFVAIQMAWTLRPFIGDPDRPVNFFREGAWGNAYVEVARMLARLVD
jgi:hypothetical protein